MDNPVKPSRAHVKLARAASEIAMSDYSENYYAAGWYGGIEYKLWGDVLKLRSKKFPQGWKPLPEFLTLSLLSETAGGWWCYGDSGLKFVPMRQWLVKYAKGLRKLKRVYS